MPVAMSDSSTAGASPSDRGTIPIRHAVDSSPGHVPGLFIVPDTAPTPKVAAGDAGAAVHNPFYRALRSEEHTSELQSLMRISYAVLCLKKTFYIVTSYYYLTCLA